MILCSNDVLNELYKDDDLMKEILAEAKKIAKESNVDLSASLDKNAKNDTKC